MCILENKKSSLYKLVPSHSYIVSCGKPIKLINHMTERIKRPTPNNKAYYSQIYPSLTKPHYSHKFL